MTTQIETDLPIHTERCKVRLFEEKDIDAFMRYRNDLDWMRYQGFKGMSRCQYAEVLLGDDSIYEGMQLAIVESRSDRLIGDLYIKLSENSAWIGYTVDPSYARQGFASEVLTALIPWLFEQDVNQIRAEVLSDNVASIRLLEKLGFTQDGRNEDGELVYTLDP